MALKMHGLTRQSFRDLRGCRKIRAQGLGEEETEPRSPLRQRAGTGAGDPRGHAHAPGPQTSWVGSGAPEALSQAPGPLLGSSTHQELEHDVSEESENGSVNSVGRSSPASPGARGGTRVSFRVTPRPALLPQLTRKLLVVPWLPPGGASRNDRLSGPTGEKARVKNVCPKSQAGLDNFEHSESEAPVPISRFCNTGSESRNLHPSDSDAQPGLGPSDL